MSRVPSEENAVVRRAMEEREKVERAVAAIASIIPDDLEYVQCPEESERRMVEAVTSAGVGEVLHAHSCAQLWRWARQVVTEQG